MRALWLFAVTGILLLSAVAAERTEKIVLLPRLPNGETLRY